jgi:hypothetical protein
MAKRSPASRTRTATNTNAIPFPDRRQTVPAQIDDATATAVLDASSADTRSDSMSSAPSEEAIRLRAYQRYLARGGQDGMDFDDWLQAEEELRKGITG